tara:strand:- start:170 stop:592 length:423 start_codon:yes stop_codon:yes gene_type:complete
MNKVIIVSGYFNPIHKGHLEYFEKSKKHGNQLWVIVNNDYQRELKNSKEFQKEDERLTIVRAIRTVDFATLSIDKDRTVIESIKQIHSDLGENHSLYFANGGDQNNTSIPEARICEELGVSLIDGLGNKIQSSSWLLKKQ